MLLRLHQDTASASSILTRRQTEPRSRSGVMIEPPRYADGNPTTPTVVPVDRRVVHVCTYHQKPARPQAKSGWYPAPSGRCNHRPKLQVVLCMEPRARECEPRKGGGGPNLIGGDLESPNMQDVVQLDVSLPGLARESPHQSKTSASRRRLVLAWAGPGVASGFVSF